MRNDKVNLRLSRELREFDFPDLPDEIVDSHGMKMRVDGGVWRFNVATGDVVFDFDQREITNPWLTYCLKQHLISCLQRVSPRESYNIIMLNTLNLSKVTSWAALSSAATMNDHMAALSTCMGEVLEYLRRECVLYNFARLRSWYLWCTDNLQEFGFDSDDAYNMEMVRVPGNEKGLAVRLDDAESGPINDAELILLRKALLADASMDREHVQQRAAVWVALAFGRNPANYAQLRLCDYGPLVEDVAIYGLQIPRIKKRQIPRSTFKLEYVDGPLAKVIQQLIDVNAADADAEAVEAAKRDTPLFRRFSPREALVGTDMHAWAWHLTSTEFTALIRSAARRYRLVSPRTGDLLVLTTRRLRYTFATNRVREGINAQELAEALDHSDLQNVRVYFDARSTIVERLDVAAAKHIGPILALFRGQVVAGAAAAVNGDDPAKRIRVMPEIVDPTAGLEHLGVCGKQEICRLYPPYSCYQCDRFQPFSDSLPVHTRVLVYLVERRDQMILDPEQSNRIAVQLDEVIYACADVVQRIQKACEHAAIN